MRRREGREGSRNNRERRRQSARAGTGDRQIDNSELDLVGAEVCLHRHTHLGGSRHIECLQRSEAMNSELLNGSCCLLPGSCCLLPGSCCVSIGSLLSGSRNLHDAGT